MPIITSTPLCTLALFIVASSGAAVSAQGPDWTFMCMRDGPYDNGACVKLDTILWDEVHNCIAEATDQKVTKPALFWQQSGNAVDDGGKMRRSLTRGAGRSLFADVDDTMSETDAMEYRRQLVDCFASNVPCVYWAYPNGVCCRANPAICVSSTNNPCKRRRTKVLDEDFDDPLMPDSASSNSDESGSVARSVAVVEAADEYPYSAERAAIQTECTIKLQGLCSELDKEGSGTGCLGTCESLMCGGYIFE